MKLDVSPQGFIDSIPVTGCRMDNGQITVSLSSYGAAIHGIYDHGSNLTLSFASLSGYRQNPLYAGSILAPNAGRISGGCLPLPQGAVTLSKNDGPHQLHGGFHNLSFRNWAITDAQESPAACAVTFSCRLADGIDGYPGNRHFTARYTLTMDNVLTMRCHASSDRPTYINMANHVYFNLTGNCASSVLEHQLQIAASRYTLLRPDHIPSGFAPCSGSPFDFARPCTLKEQAKKYPCHPQLEIGHGYNHGFLLDSPYNFSKMNDDAILTQCFHASPSLILRESISGRKLLVYTDAPCIVLYSGGFIGDAFDLEDGVRSTNSCAVAIECQDIPDTPNLVPQKMALTTSERPFHRTVVYRFF